MRIRLLTLTLILASGALCSAQTVITPEMQRNIDASTPDALPQTPAVAKERSDAEDEGLKGKVKSITIESQNLSGTATNSERHLSSIENYDEKGNQVKLVSFDFNGNPYQITVYGYLDNTRVSKIKSITYDYDPSSPPKRLVRVGADQKPRDLRITYKYGYKYIDGKLTEMQMYSNEGSRGMRYTNTRKGNILENLVFDEKGDLNQKYVFVLDGEGNKVEERSFDVIPQMHYGAKKFVYKYDSLDKRGNWTKKNASEIVTINGKEVTKLSWVNYRTITYFD